MEQLPRTRYSQEFREQSVKFFKESGLTLGGCPRIAYQAKV